MRRGRREVAVDSLKSGVWPRKIAADWHPDRHNAAPHSNTLIQRVARTSRSTGQVPSLTPLIRLDFRLEGRTLDGNCEEWEIPLRKGGGDVSQSPTPEQDVFLRLKRQLFEQSERSR